MTKPKPKKVAAKPVTLWVDGAFPEAFADDILYAPKKGVRKVRYVPASSSSSGELARYRRAALKLLDAMDNCDWKGSKVMSDAAGSLRRALRGKG